MPQTSKDRREEAKAAAAALRAKQAQAAARQRTIAIAALVVGLAVVGVLVAVILNQGGTTPAAQTTPSVATGHGGVVFDDSGVLVPPTQDVTMGSAGFAADWPQGGVLDGDPAVVTVYFDPMCPYCGLFEQSVGTMLDDLRASGEIVLDSHPLSFLDTQSNGSQYSTRVANALWTLAEEAPEAYFPFLESVMSADTQPAEGTAGPTDDELAQLALDAGAPQDVVDTFTDGTYTWWVAQATDLASQDLGSIRTPTVLVNGQALGEDVNIYDPATLQAAIEAAKG